jgi:hypothetical protein
MAESPILLIGVLRQADRAVLAAYENEVGHCSLGGAPFRDEYPHTALCFSPQAGTDVIVLKEVRPPCCVVASSDWLRLTNQHPQ